MLLGRKPNPGAYAVSNHDDQNLDTQRPAAEKEQEKSESQTGKSDDSLSLGNLLPHDAQALEAMHDRDNSGTASLPKTDLSFSPKPLLDA
ncbi:MAG TPA: hypothetical protein V6C72_02895, partial [Chroococcales cyanobacterium]